MRRVLLITLSLVLAMVSWSAVFAEGDFYVISGGKPKYSPLPKTGQTTSFATGDDGDLQKGMASPSPRFTDNNNGTVTDNLTRLIWMKNANLFGTKNWTQALSYAATVADGTGDLRDGSVAGDWRLPNFRELQSLIDYGKINPALPDNPFDNVVLSSYYWSSTNYANTDIHAWVVSFMYGFVNAGSKEGSLYYVWCVRGGP